VNARVAVAMTVVVAVGVGCGDNLRAPGAAVDAGPDDPSAPSCRRAGSEVAAVKVAQVRGSATLVTSPPGDPRLFVLEQDGRIRIISGGELLPAPFLDLRDDVGGPVVAGGEQGLLGLAFHPRYADNGRFFVYYTERAATVVASYQVTPADRDRADPASQRILLSMPDRFSNHNGGMIEFARDGSLLIATGDGGSANDPDGNGQNSQSLLGKMLRLDIDREDGERRYAIPADNPFFDGVAGAAEVYMTGLRNPWRWSFDGDTLFIADVGQDRFEELNIVSMERGRGANFGWQSYEAMRCTLNSCDPTDKQFPQLVKNHGGGAGNGWCSITGGAVYRGACYPDLEGRYFYTDYCKGGLYSLRWADQAIQDDREEEGEFPGSVSSLYPAFAGELYLTTTSGGIYHLEAQR
jgi:glucose/arabinose dehydrogenase